MIARFGVALLAFVAFARESGAQGAGANAQVAGAQRSDTITLRVGDATVDGRFLKAHHAIVTQSTIRNGATVNSVSFDATKTIAKRNGASVFQVEFKPRTGDGDQQFYFKAQLDLRTMALVHREERNGSGRLFIANGDGSRVTGSERTSLNAATNLFDFTLETPSYEFAFIDATIGTVRLRDSLVIRIPTFEFPEARRKTEWHTFRVIGRDTVRVQKRIVSAWVAEEDSTSLYTARKIWLINEPPYFPLVLTYLPDGSIRKVSQTLVGTP